jgi:hypothetical protein
MADGAARARTSARRIHARLQGALLVKRTTGDITQLRDVIQVLRKQLVRHG